MESGDRDFEDEAKSCQSFDWVTKDRHFDIRLGAHVGTAVGVCLKKFDGTNYDDARCGYGLNSQPPMSKCGERVPFGSGKESGLAVA
jgi:hypothetical protein